MQLKQKFDTTEIEFIKSPFGQQEPIGLLFEQSDKSIIFPSLSWDQITNMFRSLRNNVSFDIDFGSISWDGEELLVKKDEVEIKICLDEEGFDEFSWMSILRSIDPN